MANFQVGLGRVGVVSSSRLRCQELFTSAFWLNLGCGYFSSWIKVRFGSRVSGRYFVFCLSLRFKAGVERLIGIFFFLRPKVFKVTFSSRVLGYGLRLWNCMGWGGGPSSRLSGFTEILT